MMDRIADIGYEPLAVRSPLLMATHHISVCLVIMVVFFLSTHAMEDSPMRTACQYACAFALGWQASLICIRLRMMRRRAER